MCYRTGKQEELYEKKHLGGEKNLYFYSASRMCHKVLEFRDHSIYKLSPSTIRVICFEQSECGGLLSCKFYVEYNVVKYIICRQSVITEPG